MKRLLVLGLMVCSGIQGAARSGMSVGTKSLTFIDKAKYSVQNVANNIRYAIAKHINKNPNSDTEHVTRLNTVDQQRNDKHGYTVSTRAKSFLNNVAKTNSTRASQLQSHINTLNSPREVKSVVPELEDSSKKVTSDDQNGVDDHNKITTNVNKISQRNVVKVTVVRPFSKRAQSAPIVTPTKVGPAIPQKSQKVLDRENEIVQARKNRMEAERNRLDVTGKEIDRLIAEMIQAPGGKRYLGGDLLIKGGGRLMTVKPNEYTFDSYNPLLSASDLDKTLPTADKKIILDNLQQFSSENPRAMAVRDAYTALLLGKTKEARKMMATLPE